MLHGIGVCVRVKTPHITSSSSANNFLGSTVIVGENPGQTNSVYLRKRLKPRRKRPLLNILERRKEILTHRVLNVPYMCISLQSLGVHEFINIFPSNVPDPSSSPLFNFHTWKWRFVPASHSTLPKSNSLFSAFRFLNIVFKPAATVAAKINIISSYRGHSVL